MCRSYDQKSKWLFFIETFCIAAYNGLPEPCYSGRLSKWFMFLVYSGQLLMSSFKITAMYNVFIADVGVCGHGKTMWPNCARITAACDHTVHWRLKQTRFVASPGWHVGTVSLSLICRPCMTSTSHRRKVPADWTYVCELSLYALDRWMTHTFASQAFFYLRSVLFYTVRSFDSGLVRYFQGPFSNSNPSGLSEQRADTEAFIHRLAEFFVYTY